jgi:hypothetical protein
VISPNTGSVNATLLKASLDWILAQNDASGGPYYQKLATTKVAMGGHSLGSISTFDAEATERGSRRRFTSREAPSTARVLRK